jgi:hypothetical protein
MLILFKVCDIWSLKSIRNCNTDFLWSTEIKGWKSFSSWWWCFCQCGIFNVGSVTDQHVRGSSVRRCYLVKDMNSYHISTVTMLTLPLRNTFVASGRIDFIVDLLLLD